MKKVLLTLVALLAILPMGARQLRIQGHTVTVTAAGDSETAPPGENQDFGFDDIVNWTGEGNSRAALILQWNDDREENAIVFGYRFDGEKTGYDMVHAIVEANPRLYALFCETDMGYVIGGMGWDIDGDGEIYLYESDGTMRTPENGVFQSFSYDFDGISAADPADLWASGWITNGYWSYWVKDNVSGAFKYSDLGVSNRTITDGSWDAWTFKTFSEELGPWKPFVAAPLPDAEERFTVDGVHYRVLSASLHTVAVAAPAEGEAAYAGEITVPATVENEGVTYTVANIDPEAFAASEATAVDLSAIDRALTVGDRAFADTKALAAVRFPENVGPHRFGSRIFENAVALTTVSLPDDVAFERLGDHIFFGCRSLTDGDGLPAALYNMATVAPGQFEGTGVTALRFTSAKTLAERAFADCADLHTLDFGSNFSSIGAQAFAGCSSIEDITVRRITPCDVDASAFDDAIYATATLHIPFSATSNYAAHAVWGKFVNVVEDDAMIVDGATISVDNLNYRAHDYAGDGTLTLAVAHGSYSGDIVIPETVTVGDDTYDVTAIDDFAFRSCTLNSIDIPESVTRIGSNAFNLTKFPANTQVNLPSMVDHIGTGAFAGSNVAMVTRTLRDGQPQFTVVPDSLFSGCSSLFSTFILTDKLEVVGDYAFYNTKVTGDISAAPLKSVGKRAFYSYTTNLIFGVPETLKHIGDDAFYYKTFVGGTLTVRPGVEYGTQCFGYVTGIGEVEVLDGVTGIPAQMFFRTSITNFKDNYLPESLISIGEQAFRMCYSFTGEVHFPSSLEVLGARSFEETATPAITFPDDCKLTKLTGISNTPITTLHIPASMTEIEDSGLSWCTALKTVTGGENVRTIGANAFYYCTALESVELHEGLTQLLTWTFMNCKSIKVMDIPMSVTFIQGQALRGLTSLTDLILPASLEQITEYNGWGAFDQSNENANVWYCMTSTSRFTKGYNAVDCGYSYTPSFHFINFAHYYVLHGMKAAFNKLYSAYPYEEVQVTIPDLGCTHSVDENSVCNITASPLFEQGVASATREEVKIPESFARANRKHFGGNLTYTLDLQEELPADAAISLDETAVDEDGNHTVTANISGLPNGTYHYRLTAAHTDGSKFESPWHEFVISNQSGVGNVAVDADKATPVAYYNVTGQRSDRPFHGLNIVVYSDGHTEKMTIK